MIETILLAFIIAKLKGYKLTPLFKSWTIYPIIGFELLYIFIEATIFHGNYTFVKYTYIIKPLCLYIFIILVFKYKQYKNAIIGSAFMILGGILNDIAISANNGKMPVFPYLSYMTGYAKSDSFVKVSDIHALGNAATKLKYLTDIFDTGYCIMSIGDIFIRFFPFIIVLGSIKYANRKKINDLNINL